MINSDDVAGSKAVWLAATREAKAAVLKTQRLRKKYGRAQLKEDIAEEARVAAWKNYYRDAQALGADDSTREDEA